MQTLQRPKCIDSSICSTDGSVYIEAEGPQDKLNELLEFSKKGPKHAQVDKVEYEFLEPTNNYTNFDYDF